MEVRILGSLEVIHEGRSIDLGGLGDRQLLALLAINANQSVSVGRIAEALWDDAPPSGLNRAIQARVFRIRRALAGCGDCLQTRPGGYMLALEPDNVDALRFERLASRGRSCLNNGEPELASELLGQALLLWRGPPLSDIAGWPAVVPDIARLDEARMAALEERLDADLACGRHATLIAELEGLTASYPLRERFWGQRMLALYRSGRQADALRSFQALRTVLREELGIDPAPEITRLEQAILEQAEGLNGVPVAQSTSTRSGTTQVGDPAIRVLLVDDHPMWREAMRTSLERHGRVIVIGEAGSAAEAVAEAADLRPEVVLMDLHLPDVDGTAATRDIVQAVPGAKILMLSSSGEESDVLDAMRAGARGYLIKTGAASEILDGVVRAARGEAVFSPSLAGVILEHLRTAPAERTRKTGPTPSQRNTLRLLADGLTFADVATRLGQTESAVRRDVQATLSAVQSRADESNGSARGVRTVLFVDVCRSTEIAAGLGDRRWRRLLESYHACTRRAIEQGHGRLVKTTGDGVLAIFDDPEDGIAAARAVLKASHELDLEVRVGVHVGECELTPDDVHGMAVHIAARVVAKAKPGEILVTQTVRDLVVGGGASFDDRGSRTLKGVPDRWRLYAVSESIPGNQRGDTQPQ